LWQYVFPIKSGKLVKKLPLVKGPARIRMGFPPMCAQTHSAVGTARASPFVEEHLVATAPKIS
jgi:hypothetical protein